MASYLQSFKTRIKLLDGVISDYAPTEGPFCSTSRLQSCDSEFNLKNVSNRSNRWISSAANVWSWLVKPRVVDSRAPGLSISSGEQDSAIVQKCGGGKAEPVKRDTSH